MINTLETVAMEENGKNHKYCEMKKPGRGHLHRTVTGTCRWGGVKT